MDLDGWSFWFLPLSYFTCRVFCSQTVSSEPERGVKTRRWSLVSERFVGSAKESIQKR